MEKRRDICSCSQLQKVSKQKNPCEDRISCLPDDILYFIQSLLDYKKVAQMSILSHRWLNLWKHTHALEFGVPMLHDLHLCAPIVPGRRNQKPDCDKIISVISHVSDGSYQMRECKLPRSWIRDKRNQKQECATHPGETKTPLFWMSCHPPNVNNQKSECDKIVNWMSRVSKMLKGDILNELKVSYTLYKRYKKDIDSWWDDTLARESQSIELQFLINDDCQDSSYVFPERFLSFCSDCFLWTLSSDAFDSHFLESSGFKSLKSLSLQRMLITHKSIDFLLLKCPFLETLEVVDSPVLVFFQIKKGQSLALKYLKLEDCENLGTIDISYCNIVSLKITAYLWVMLKQLPRLVELCIDGTPIECSRETLCHPELKTLTLSTSKPKALLEEYKLTSQSQLAKLKRLVINVDALADKRITGLIDFIKACPLLEEFVLMLDWIKPQRSRKMLKEKPEKSGCHKRLKVVEFLGYYGRVSDVELIAHIMVNADNLEKVIVDPWNPKHTQHSYEEEAQARSLALQQLKELMPPLVELIIR